MVTEVRKYHPSKFTRFVLYPFGFLIFALVLAIILILANGYSFIFENNKIELQKTGMIIINSRPIDSKIYIDNKDTKKKTSFAFLPVKFNKISPQKHLVTVKKQGFRTWQKEISVKPNLVSWLNYILLFPEDLKLQEEDALKNKTVLAQSKNKRYLLVSGLEEDVKTLFIYDINNGSLTKIKPSDQTVENLRRPEIVTAEFNQNNDNILLKLKDNTFAYINTNRDNQIFPLSSITLPINKITWSSTEANDLYILSGKSLYRVNVNDLRVDKPIAQNVIDFTSEKNRNLYLIVENEADYSLVQTPLEGGREEILAQSVIKDTAYKLSLSNRTNSVAVLPVNEKVLTVYYRLEGKMSSLLLSKDIKDYKWSADGRSIYYQNETKVKKFDFEKEEETIAELGSKILSMDWYYDENHYLVNTEKGFYVIDFDNFNKVEFDSRAVKSFYLDPKLSNFIFIDRDNKTIRYNSSL